MVAEAIDFTRRSSACAALHLVALLAALLSAVAVALAARGFAAEHLDASAMLRVLGQSQRTIAGAYTTEFALIGLFASSLGVALGYVVHYAFVLLLAGLVESALPPPSLWPVVFGLGMGLTLLFAFGLPPVLQLAQVPRGDNSWHVSVYLRAGHVRRACADM